MYFAVLLLSVAACASAVPTGCHFDGHTYQAGETIEISHCLATMKCLGNELLGDMVQLGGVCSDKRGADGQAGCDYDGSVYDQGETIIMKGCVGKMTCLGHNLLSDIVPLYGQCPSEMTKRDVDGQSGCLFDGTVYAPGDKIIIKPCLGEFTCLGHNNYSPITSYGGVCP